MSVEHSQTTQNSSLGRNSECGPSYLSQDQADRLKELSDRTRVPQAAYFREAVEDLRKNCEETKKGKK
jgi:predicted DNA-binding protein